MPTPAEDWRQAGVDVVIPIKDHQRTIVHCLASLMQQTCRPRQIVLVDDGGRSRDHSIQLAHEFARANDLEIRVVVRKWSIGRAVTLKRQSREFTGDVMLVLDGDTVLESPDYLQRCVQDLYQGVGIASACGSVMPLGRRQRDAIADTAEFHKWLDGDDYRESVAEDDGLRRLWHWLGDGYGECVGLYQQHLINRGQMDRFGSIGHPVGGAVVYRRRYLQDLFARYEPIRGDDLTGVEDIFIGLALATQGYRNIQLEDVTARVAQVELHCLPWHAHRWSTAFLQVGHYFDALLCTPLKMPRYWWGRGRHAGSRGSGSRDPASGDFTGHAFAEPVGEQRRIREAYRQAFGEGLTELRGRPIGHALMLSALERVGFPTVLLVLALCGAWSVLGAVVLAESSVALAVLALLAPAGRRWQTVAKGIVSTPVRYALMATELFTLLRFSTRLWVTGEARWQAHPGN